MTKAHNAHSAVHEEGSGVMDFAGGGDAPPGPIAEPNTTGGDLPVLRMLQDMNQPHMPFVRYASHIWVTMLLACGGHFESWGKEYLDQVIEHIAGTNMYALRIGVDCIREFMEDLEQQTEQELARLNCSGQDPVKGMSNALDELIESQGVIETLGQAIDVAYDRCEEAEGRVYGDQLKY
jgi:hypothetical protein